MRAAILPLVIVSGRVTMRNSKLVRSVLFAAAAALMSTAAAGAVTGGAQIDQFSATTVNSLNGGASQFHGFTASQTFTAGISGQLTDVTVTVWNEGYAGGMSGDLRVAINPVDGFGAPETTVELAVATVPVAALSVGTPTATEFQFTAPADLVAGTSYAITISQINGGHEHVWWAGSSGDTYAGGAEFETFGYATGDFAFETYMFGSSTFTEGGRSGYCSVAGDTWRDGTSIAAGTFLNLVSGQSAAGHYQGATHAHYLQGLGISCDTPAGYVATGETVGYYGHGDPGLYRYYAKTG